MKRSIRIPPLAAGRSYACFFLLLLCVLVSAGCSSSRKVKISDASVSDALAAAREFHRESFGFTSLPTDPNLEFTVHRDNIIDTVLGNNIIVLEFGGKTLKFVCVAPSANGQGYRWVSEKEIFYAKPGSRASHHSPNNQERVQLLYEVVNVFGNKNNELCVSYVGSDPNLMKPDRDLRLEDVSGKLRLWSNWAPPENTNPKSARTSASSVLDDM